jgi:hypothetical protein
VTGFWARAADSVDWHSCIGSTTDTVRRPRCGALQWPSSKDDATRPVTAGGVFGPCCRKCATIEGM